MAGFRVSLRLFVFFCVVSSVAPQHLFCGDLPVAYLNHVVAIGRKETAAGPNQGKWAGEATGFFYAEFLSPVNDKDGSYAAYLVTNRHVLEEHISMTTGPLSVRLNTKSGEVQEVDFPLVVDGKSTWHAHPDPLIDLAVVRLNGPLLNQIGKIDYFRSNTEVMNRTQAKDLGLSEGQGVFVLGFPMNLVGQRQDYVVVRQGSIARVRDSLDNPTEVRSFLVDSFIFPGNSGGPVVLKPGGVQFPGEKGPIMTAFLLGVVRAYLPYTDVAISPQTKRARITFEENSGLTEVIPAEYIGETIRDFK